MMKRWNKTMRILSLCLIICLAAGCSPSEPSDSNLPQDAGNTATEKVRTLSVEKEHILRQGWDDDGEYLDVFMEYSYVTLDEPDGAFPELAEALNQLSVSMKNAMEDEFDNLCSIAEEVSAANPEDFETYVSTLDVQVRRADSVAVSLLSDSFSDYGRIEDFRALHGTTLDSRTGQELKLTDVITNMEQLPELVQSELKRNMLYDEMFTETAAADYFANKPEDGISWTLDYNGVSFYFGPGDLADEEYGRLNVTVQFKDCPDVFAEKYLEVPEAYTVGLPLHTSFFTDVNGDWSVEELMVAANPVKPEGFLSWGGEAGCSDFGIYLNNEEGYFFEEWYAYGFRPYYVKAEDGTSWIYLYCRNSLEETDDLTLQIFRLDGGTVTRELVQMGVEEGKISDIFQRSAARKTVTVTTAEELLEAIGPDTEILIGEGQMNLSTALQNLWDQGGSAWNAEHKYVQLQECYDGVELVIQDAENLRIAGASENPADTELVIEPRYGAVLTFKNCRNVELASLTMGHTQMGECTGNVVNFSRCENALLQQLDLYGCGVYGLSAKDSGNFHVRESVLRDCSRGPVDIEGGSGFFRFYDCSLTGSEAYAYYDGIEDTQLYFNRCTFGPKETEYFWFREDLEAVNCSWSEDIEIYPEFGY